MLTFTRDLIALRKRLPDLRSGRYAEVSRGARYVGVAPRNPRRRGVPRQRGPDVHHVDGVVALSRNREWKGETVAERLSLGKYEGFVFDIS